MQDKSDHRPVVPMSTSAALNEIKPIHLDDRFDWVWNTLTVACLVYTTSCVIAILQPFVIGGLTVTEAAAMIAQGAGITVLSKGALTKEGQAGVQKLLKKVGIAPRWYSEVTLAASVLLLLITSSLHASLPKLGEVYLQQGREYHAIAQLGEARRKYEKALKLNPHQAAAHVALGELDESLGELENAEAHYRQARTEGSLLAFDRLGRVYLAQAEFEKAETILQLGLNETQNQAELQYSLSRNLGRVLLEQKQFEQSQRFLRQAIELEQKLPTTIPGRGMANCFLSQVLQAQGNSVSARQQLNVCQRTARPETLDEYRWLIKTGLRHIAEKTDTTAIVQQR